MRKERAKSVEARLRVRFIASRDKTKIFPGREKNVLLTASAGRRWRGRGSSGWLRDREYQVAALSLGELAGASAPAAAEKHDEGRGDARQQRGPREQRPDDT